MTDHEQESDWSVPETAVMTAIRRALDGDEGAVLATIVAVEGSAYRRPGAKMVVSEAGDGVGSITAGCLEDEVLDLAEQVLAGGRRRVERFDLTASGEDVWGLGLGCNGVIDVLLEPLEESYRPVVDAYDRDEPVVTLTAVESDDPAVTAGSRAVLPDGTFDEAAWHGDEWPPGVVDDLRGPVETLLANEQSDTVTVEREAGDVRVFVDSVTPPPELVVFGTGHDVRPVVEIGRRMDFRVTVAGFRGGTATEERFPAADRVVSTSPARVREELDLGEDTYAVVMTHNFVDDRLTVEGLLETPVPYVGLMGPTERFQEMLDEFTAEGRALSDAELDRVYTPIGLDLGGGTPYQVALSIVGEVQAVRNDRDPKHLRDRKSPIHERVEVEP